MDGTDWLSCKNCVHGLSVHSNALNSIWMCASIDAKVDVILHFESKYIKCFFCGESTLNVSNNCVQSYIMNM